MADKTLKMWLQHVRSQVAEILNDYSLHIFPWNILELFYMPFSCSPYPLFVSLPLAFSLALSSLTPSSAIRFWPFLLALCFSSGWGDSFDFSFKIGVRSR